MPQRKKIYYKKLSSNKYRGKQIEEPTIITGIENNSHNRQMLEEGKKFYKEVIEPIKYEHLTLDIDDKYKKLMYHIAFEKADELNDLDTLSKLFSKHPAYISTYIFETGYNVKFEHIDIDTSLVNEEEINYYKEGKGLMPISNILK